MGLDTPAVPGDPAESMCQGRSLPGWWGLADRIGVDR